MVHVVSFGTTGVSTKYRDYSKDLKRLEREAHSLGCSFEAYDQSSESFVNSRLAQNRYPMRKGAGYWSWKPDIILDAISKNPDQVILYLDADFELVRLSELLDGFNKENFGIALAPMNHQLKDWITKRCAEHFKFSSTMDSLVYSAGAILVNPENDGCVASLIHWRDKMSIPKLLLDPVFTLRRNHRHDQTIISAMIAKEMIKVSDLPNIIFIEGVSSEVDYERAWLRSKKTSNNVTSRFHFFLMIRSFIFHKWELMNFWLTGIIPLNRRKKFYD
jgi:hypothetical protein